jgi:hypothetical protein
MLVGQDYLEIPPGKDRVEVDAVCSSDDTYMALSGPVYVTRALNHMHYLGMIWFSFQSQRLYKYNEINKRYAYYTY